MAWADRLLNLYYFHGIKDIIIIIIMIIITWPGSKRSAETRVHMPEEYSIFFYRYFTTMPLLDELLKKGIDDTGTVMAN